MSHRSRFSVWCCLAIAMVAPGAFAQAPQDAPAAPAPAPAEAPAPAPAEPPPPAAEAAPESQPAAEAPAPAPSASQPAPPPATVAAPPLQTYPVPVPAERERPEPDDGTMGSHQEHFTVGLGLRTSFIDSEGFDPFSSNDLMSQVSVSAGRVTTVEGPLSVVALLGWDYGGAGDSARGSDSQLYAHRLFIGGEGRYHFFRRLYAFVRLSPAVLHTIATLRDPTADVTREATSWTFGADGSLGAAFEMLGKASGGSKDPRGWIMFDGGYGWATSSDLTMVPDEDQSPPTRTAALDLGELAVRGPFVRVGLALTF